ncbi:UNVERIFIED_CONTAM: hypothetical protein FKN15_014438 [Acipenser sinensis]
MSKPKTKKVQATDATRPDPISCVAGGSNPQPGSGEDLAILISAVNKIQNSVESLRSENRESIATLQGTLDSYGGRLQEVERSLSNISDRVMVLEALDGRGWRNNLCVFGVSEGVEGRDLTTFTSQIFANLFGKDKQDSAPPVLDRAHCLLILRSKEGDRPCPIILRVHYFPAKEKILRLARDKGDLYFQGRPVYICPDFCADMAKRCATFNSVKAQLREAGVKCSLLHPARLLITHNNSRMIFTTPQDAAAFYKDQIVSALNSA